MWTNSGTILTKNFRFTAPWLRRRGDRSWHVKDVGYEDKLRDGTGKTPILSRVSALCDNHDVCTCEQPPCTISLSYARTRIILCSFIDVCTQEESPWAVSQTSARQSNHLVQYHRRPHIRKLSCAVSKRSARRRNHPMQ